MFGTAPIPIWRVAPSVMNERASSAMASSMASGCGRGSVKGAPSASTRTSMSSSGRVLAYSGPSERVRGRWGLTSTTQQPVGVLAGQEQLVVGGAEVEREVDVAVVRRRGEHRHHPGVVAAEDGCELAEAAGDQLDAGPVGQQHPLGRTEESAAVGDVGVGEHRVVAEQEGAAEGQVDPVVTTAEGGEERVGVGRPQSEADGVGRADPRRRPRRACRFPVPWRQCGTGPPQR